MSDWKYCTLGDVLTFQRGFDLPSQKRFSGSYPIIASTGIVGSHIGAKVEGPGLVIGRSGSIGGGQYIESDFWPLNTTLWVKKFNGNSVRFCYYLIKNIDFQTFNVGSGVPTLNRNHIHPLPINLPPLAEQQAIASVLGALDDKIENNRRINKTLEEMARAIFKSWFVDFDPVHAKTEGWQPTHMDTGTAALFPGSFGEDGLPEGWREGLVGDIAHLNKATLKPTKFAMDLIEHYSLPAFDEGKIPAIDFGGGVKSNKTIVPKNSVLLSKLNPNIERVWLPIFLTEHAVVSSTEFLVLTEKGIGCRNYLYSLFCSRSFSTRYKSLVTGTSKSHQRVRPQMLLDMNVKIPTAEPIAAFNEQVGRMFEKIIVNDIENQSLAELRDTLLPRLMSGKICVQDAEQEVEAVA